MLEQRKSVRKEERWREKLGMQHLFLNPPPEACLDGAVVKEIAVKE